MEVFKYILFFALLGLVIWLTIDTVIYIVKKVKAKKLKQKQQANQISNNDENKTE